MQVFQNGIKTNTVIKGSDAFSSDKPAVIKGSESLNAKSFQSVLNDKISESIPLTFSKHASLRLDSRNIKLSSEQISRVEDGLRQARQKGINDSLVVVDDIRLVVNVKSKTVITAMNKQSENIFTNIDGAVIV